MSMAPPEADVRCWYCGRPLSERPTTKQCPYPSARRKHRCGRKHGAGNAQCELSIGECNAARKAEKERRRQEDPDRYLDAALVLKALRGHYGKGSHNGGHLAKWALLEEVPVATGFDRQRMDAWAIALWPTMKFETHAIEIKVDRADFVFELERPQKRAAAMALSNRFYFVTGKGLAKPHEIPSDCGLIEVKGGRCHKIIEAPFREIADPTWAFVASIARQTLRAGAKT